MTQAEMNYASLRLYEIGTKLFSELCKEESCVTNDEKYVVSACFDAEPFEVYLKMSVFPENGLVTFFSVLPFEVSPVKVSEFARLICATNYDEMYAGNFDFSPSSGKVVFRLALPFRGSILSEDLIRESIHYCIDTVSKNNSALFEASRE